MGHKLFLHHEVVLLALSDDKGQFTGSMFIYSVAGAMISELLLHQKIVTKDENKIVEVVDDKPMGDEILDELIAEIRDSKKPRPLKDWVSKAATLKDLKHRIAQQLCDMGILRHDEQKVLWVFTRQRYPELDGTVESAVRASMADVMFNEDVKPDGQTAVLISLASYAGLLEDNFAKVELRQHKDRIKKLADGNILATGATKETIEAIQTAMMVATLIPVFAAATTSAAISSR